MRKTTFFKTMLAAVMLLVGSAGVWGQATLPFAYDAGKPTDVAGLTQTGLGTDYSSSPKMKFDTSGDNLVLSFNTYPGVLSFKIKWNQSVAAERFPGEFVLMQSANGTDYTVVQQYNSTSGTALTNGTVVTETFSSLLSTTRYLKWEYTTKSNGNIAIGLISLTEGVPENTVVTPIINVTGSVKTNDTYINSAQISLSSSTAGASVYYTTDGSAPTTASTLYTTPLTITATTTIKAFAVKSGMSNSPVAEKTITIVPPATATVPYAEAFNNTLGDWYAHQVAGDKPWLASANGALANGFGGGNVESWLISPQLSSPLAGLALSFNYASKYIGNPISVKVSQNYLGYGSPAAATWTELTTIAAPTVQDNNYTVKATGNIIAPVSGNLHFALVYDTDANYSDWRITNVSVTVAPAPSTPTITVTEVSMPSLHAIVGSKDTTEIHVSAVNLTADVALTISGTDAAQFKVEPATLVHSSGTLAETLVNVIYQPSAAGTHTATLTISSTGAVSKVYDLSGAAFVTNGAGTVDNPFTVADVKLLNNAFASTTKYWVTGYIIGVPSAGNTEGNLTAVDLEAPFTANSAIALSDAQNETDLTRMIGVQLPTGAVRTALNLVDNATNLNKKVKVYGILQAYFTSAPGVYATSDYAILPSALPTVDAQQFKVYTTAGKLHVIAANNEQIIVLDVLGKQVYANTLKAGHTTIELPTKGILVVKIGNAVKKVIL